MYIFETFLNYKKNNFKANNHITDFFNSLLIILFIDYILIILFGKKARYYQLHSIINAIISFRILPDIKNFIYDPINAYKLLNTNLESYLILCLHIYHIIISKKLYFIELFHHILFVGFGVIPTIYFINTNQIYLGYICCSGLPGVFEYGLLTLLKNNVIKFNTQKFYTVYLYNYFRYPCAMYGCYLNLILYNYNNILNKENFYFTFYINILLFLNGSIFNHLTIKSYYKCIK